MADKTEALKKNLQGKIKLAEQAKKEFQDRIAKDSLAYAIEWQAEGAYEFAVKGELAKSALNALESGKTTLPLLIKYANSELLRIARNGPSRSTSIWENMSQQLKSKFWAELLETVGVDGY